MWAATAAAHKPSDSYLTLRIEAARIAGRWDIALRDLDYAIGLDANDDGTITWGEVRLRHAAIAAYALPRLRIAAAGADCPTRAIEHQIDSHTDGSYAVIRFAADCPGGEMRRLDLHYDLLFELDAQHRGIARVVTAAGAQTLLFSPAQRTAQVDLARSGRWRSLREFWVEGLWHIWTGFDHILFLLCLLMPAVLRREHGRWSAVASFGTACRETLKVVTAFTVAHSITLGLAALGALHLPSRLVESAIAASVVVAALNNAKPLFGEARWLVGFGFGLLHGLAFASVFADPDLAQGQLLPALIGFNAGVESGQLAIVAVFLPPAYFIRNSWFYRRFTLVAGSSVIAAVAMLWMVERCFALRLLS